MSIKVIHDVYEGRLSTAAHFRSKLLSASDPSHLVLAAEALLLLLLLPSLASSIRPLLHCLLNLVPHLSLLNVEHGVEIDREVKSRDEEFGEGGEKVEGDFARYSGDGWGGSLDVDVDLVSRGDGL
jgi:hypothetical protein